MKSILNRIIALLVISTFTGALAFGKVLKREVIIGHPLTVNGTLLKKGTYDVAYDDETGELTIKRNRKVVVTAQARLDKTNDRFSLYTRGEADDPTKPPALISIFLNDGNQATIVDKADNKAANARP
jgi:hypothetical protein